MPLAVPFDADSELQPVAHPPAAIEAEQALLAALLADNGHYDAVAAVGLTAEDFADEHHGAVFAMIAGEIEAGRAVSATSLAAYVRGTKSDDHSLPVDETYVSELYEVGISIAMHGDGHAAHLANVVKETATRRALFWFGLDTHNRAAKVEYEDGAPQQLEAAESALFALAEGGPGGKARALSETLPAVLDAVDRRFRGDGPPPGLGLGLGPLDDMLQGLQAGQLVTLAGRPAMGKTALALTILRNVARSARQGGAFAGPVLFVSLEMGAGPLQHRLLAQESGVNSARIRDGRMSEAEMAEVLAGGRRLEALPLMIDDTPDLTVSQIGALARRAKRRAGGLGLLAIDHLGWVRPGNPDMPRHLHLGQASRELRNLGKRLEVPVLMLHQLNRGVEGRDDHRPTLADLRESGQIEENSEIVLMVYREEYYLRRQEPQRRQSESDEKFAERQERWESTMQKVQGRGTVIVSKNRDGAQGDVPLAFHAPTTAWRVPVGG